MDNHDTQIELLTQIRERQQKFVYYLIALSVASIAFSVTRTSDQLLNYTHTFVGISILTWTCSIFCGFQFLHISLKALHQNYNFLDEVVEADLINDTQAVKKADEKQTQIIASLNKRSIRNFNWQQYLFFAGLASFIAWHIIQMSQN